MKKITCLLAFLISACLVSWFVYAVNSVQPVYNTYNQGIADREQASLTMPETKYSITKTFLLNHTDGTPVKFHVVKFECCLQVSGMVKDGEIYIGYFNQIKAHPITATNSEEMVEVPELDLFVIIHETHHASLLANKNNCDEITRVCLEKTAYGQEHLIRQIKSLQEDGYFGLTY